MTARAILPVRPIGDLQSEVGWMDYVSRHKEPYAALSGQVPAGRYLSVGRCVAQVVGSQGHRVDTRGHMACTQ